MSHAEPSVLNVDDERVNIDLLVDLLKPPLSHPGGDERPAGPEAARGEPRPGHPAAGRDDAGEWTATRSAGGSRRTRHERHPRHLRDRDERHRRRDEGASSWCRGLHHEAISPPIVEARVEAHLENKHARDFIEDRNRVLQGMVIEKTREVVATQDATILSMATLAETRDPETGHHLQRTQGYVRSLARRLREHRRYGEELDEKAIDLLFKSAPLHDIGKVGVPDRILLKPAKLDPDEFHEMKKHVQFGYEAIVATEKLLASAGVSSAAASFLRYAREIAGCHHEKWDGSGYPEGMGGEDIPLSARLMMLADVYDALRSERCYKPAFPTRSGGRDPAGRGTFFDPDVVDAFCALDQEFVEIARSHAE
jgi:putative two-component system response regulator